MPRCSKKSKLLTKYSGDALSRDLSTWASLCTHCGRGYFNHYGSEDWCAIKEAGKLRFPTVREMRLGRRLT